MIPTPAATTIVTRKKSHGKGGEAGAGAAAIYDPVIATVVFVPKVRISTGVPRPPVVRP